MNASRDFRNRFLPFLINTIRMYLVVYSALCSTYIYDQLVLKKKVFKRASSAYYSYTLIVCPFIFMISLLSLFSLYTASVQLLARNFILPLFPQNSFLSQFTIMTERSRRISTTRWEFFFGSHPHGNFRSLRENSITSSPTVDCIRTIRCITMKGRYPDAFSFHPRTPSTTPGVFVRQNRTRVAENRINSIILDELSRFYRRVWEGW